MGANRGRVAAARALLGVERGLHVEDVLAEQAAVRGDDRALAWYLTLGVLRRRPHVDASLRPALRQPLTRLDSEVRATLRVGAFEILFARTQRYAAVHQAVEVARALGVGRASGLVNAVLRRVEEPRQLSRADALDHPPWLVARWDERYGPEATQRWCDRNNVPAKLFAVVRDDPEALAGQWREAGLAVGSVSIGDVSLPDVLQVEEHRGTVTDLPGFAEGLFWIQDAASVAVADLVEVGEGTRVLDACAAPGGKSFRLASRGAQITAVDQDPRRLDMMRESLDRLSLQADLGVHDWLGGSLPEGRWDAVLVDAPCTALGLLRRHPDIRWRRQLVDVIQAPERQRIILANAAAHVAPGGQLVYAVCSPEPEEGPQVVTWFLENHPEFALDRTLSTAPPRGDEDAFQAARLVRRAP
ncbi:MAG: MFS transporter [Deltaproteobacteria bacterium]|nr:MFS transporter [Deltaproteobacteria bacterium]